MAMGVTVIVVVMTMVVMVGVRTYALNVMVVTFLRLPHLVFRANDLHPVLAKLAIHIGITGFDLFKLFDKGIDHLGVIVQIRRLDQRDVRMGGGVIIRPLVNTFDQTTGKQKVGKYDDLFEAEAMCSFQTIRH